MFKPHRFGSAVSAIVLASMIAGCAAQQQKVAVKGKGDQQVGLATRALLALNARDATTAVAFAEAAVGQSPDDAALRALLGHAYFAGGRFASAEGAYTDSLSINSNQPRVVLKLALVQTALGKNSQAAGLLRSAQSMLNASDYGLALALAGEAGEAIQVLDHAARQANADSTVRQNLALAHALAGEWTEARTIASQDIPADKLASRMNEWMLLASASKPADRLASVIGVKPAALDPGQPVRLALNQSAASAVVASVAPAPAYVAPAVAPPAEQFVDVARAPIAPKTFAEASEPVAPSVLPVPAEPAQQLASAAQTPAPLPELAEAVPPAPPPVRSFVAEAAAVASTTTAMLSEAAHKAEAVVTNYFAKKKPQKVAVKPAKVRRVAAAYRPVRAGDTVIQLGSYRSPEQVMQGWSRLSAKHPALRAYLPLRARFVSPNGTYWRLSVQGFGNRGEAAARCEALRSNGAKCFVRPVAGDAPVRIASN